MTSTAVIVPVHNRLSLLKETVASLAAQTLGDSEFILIDDRSESPTSSYLEALASSDSRFRIIHKSHEDLPGAQSSRNLGLDAVTAESVLFLDSDDLLEPSCLLDRHRLLATSDGFDIVVGSQAMLDSTSGAKHWVNLPLENGRELDRFLRISHPIDVPWVNGGVLFRTSSLRRSRVRWRPEFHWDDVAFHFECLLSGMKAKWMPRTNTPDSFYRIHSQERYGSMLSTEEGIASAGRMIQWMAKELAQHQELTEDRRAALLFSFFNACVLRAVDDKRPALAFDLVSNAHKSSLLTDADAKKMQTFIVGRRTFSLSRRLTYYWNRFTERTIAPELFDDTASTYGTVSVA